jgi:hypothetical protein
MPIMNDNSFGDVTMLLDQFISKMALRPKTADAPHKLR